MAKDRDKGKGKKAEIIPLKPAEISKDCPYCGATVTATPRQMRDAMTLHQQMSGCSD